MNHGLSGCQPKVHTTMLPSWDATSICTVTFSFAVVVDIVTELTKIGASRQLLYADDIALISEAIEGLMENFRKLKEA